MSDVAAFFRLLGAGFALVRADALIPREIDPILPPGALAAARMLRMFAGPAARRGRPGERLARVLEVQGPVAIKLGQVLSTRADMFGRPFAEDLSHLKDALPPFAQAEALAIVTAALERPFDEVFADFGPVVGAASLAQAHAATLVDGRKVAVKVLRPGVEARVARDVQVLDLGARLIERWVPAARRLEPRAVAATIAQTLTLELDLRLEAAGASELSEVMAADPYMRAPKIVWDGVSRRTLVMEWAEGRPLSDPASLDLPGLDRPTLANNLIRAFLAQAMDHGVFHADLHEGNLFIAAPAAITAVDFGMIGRLDPVARRHLAEMLWGFLQRDYMRVAKAHFDAGYVPAHHSIEAFAQALRTVGEPHVGKPANEISMGRLLGQLFEITALFDMKLRPELILLQKTMVTVEGVARTIDPAHDRWAAAEPIVRRWITRELGPAARARELVEDATKVLKALARLADPPAAPPPPEPPAQGSAALWFAVGAALSGAAFVLASLLRHP
jgi:ubiquinone biosynthesis protein